MLRPTDRSRPLAAKTVLEIHLIIRGALTEAEKRGTRQPERSPRRPRTTAQVDSQSRARDLDRPATAGVPRRGRRASTVPTALGSRRDGHATQRAARAALEG